MFHIFVYVHPQTQRVQAHPHAPHLLKERPSLSGERGVSRQTTIFQFAVYLQYHLVVTSLPPRCFLLKNRLQLKTKHRPVRSPSPIRCSSVPSDCCWFSTYSAKQHNLLFCSFLRVQQQLNKYLSLSTAETAQFYVWAIFPAVKHFFIRAIYKNFT